MITNDQFTFIHVHKTGGRSLNSVITQCIPGSQTVGYHFPHALLPVQQRHFASFRTVGWRLCFIYLHSYHHYYCL